MNRPNNLCLLPGTANTSMMLNELYEAECEETLMQRHLQRVKDPKGLQQLRSLREHIRELEDRLDGTSYRARS